MQKWIVLFLVGMLSLAACREDDVTGTIEWCNKVNSKLTTYQHKSLDLVLLMKQEGEISGYLDDGVLMKAIVTTHTDLQSNIETYYYESGDIVCVYKQQFVYNKPRFFDSTYAAKLGEQELFDEKKTKITTNSYYFYDNRLVKWVNDQKQDVPSTDRAYEFTGAALKKDAEKLVKMFREL
jgi:hypothetical protein